MNDDNLENLIRSLKPAPLPPDLKARMSVEPIRNPVVRNWQHVVIGSAAAILIAAIGFITLLRPDQPAVVDSPDPIESETPVSIIKKESTLLNSNTLAFEEIDGQLWEVSEEEWQDETLALCSAGPVKLHSTVIRREVVCALVEFQ